MVVVDPSSSRSHLLGDLEQPGEDKEVISELLLSSQSQITFLDDSQVKSSLV